MEGLGLRAHLDFGPKGHYIVTFFLFDMVVFKVAHLDFRPKNQYIAT